MLEVVVMHILVNVFQQCVSVIDVRASVWASVAEENSLLAVVPNGPSQKESVIGIDVNGRRYIFIAFVWNENCTPEASLELSRSAMLRYCPCIAQECPAQSCWAFCSVNQLYAF